MSDRRSPDDSEKSQASDDAGEKSGGSTAPATSCTTEGDAVAEETRKAGEQVADQPENQA